MQHIESSELVRAISQGELRITNSKKKIPGLDYEMIEENLKNKPERNKYNITNSEIQTKDNVFGEEY